MSLAEESIEKSKQGRAAKERRQRLSRPEPDFVSRGPDGRWVEMSDDDIRRGPDGLGRHHYTLCWRTNYVAGHPLGEYGDHERGQCFFAPLPQWARSAANARRQELLR